MTNACFDASALVSLFVGDEFGDRTDAYIERHTPTILVSDFAVVEFASAISKLVRMNLLPASTAQAVFADFDDWRRRLTTQVALDASDLIAAGGFLRRLEFNLRTGDAIHIAIAERTYASLVTFDLRMAEVSVALGVDVAPA
jgi:predicted nucleic acid-binding protein